MIRKKANDDSQYEYDFYLCGAVAHDESAMEWREKVEKSLPIFRFFNPLSQEENDAKGARVVEEVKAKYKLTGKTLRENFKELRQIAAEGNVKALEDLKAIMWEIVIPNDMAGVSCSKALIVYVKAGKRVCGTFVEMYEAFLMQGKPVYMVSEIPYVEMNNWEIALCSIIFRSTDELIKYFSRKTNQAKIARL